MKTDYGADSHPFDTLAADRAALSERARMPSWLSPALGLITGAWVASPALFGRSDDSFGLFLYVAALVLVLGATRATGVRLHSVGARGRIAFGVLVPAGLLLYSASLALVSLELTWWSLVPSLLMAAVTFGAVRMIDHSRRSKLQSGH
ncbi:hypothetical protein [Georgenia sp. SYP-B2076]|uniref:hypothetical protein n=1 Tax=Georgenia sp. SYP-B2076 TaxID=2495881 RepID=UPI000F8CC267|nr:hypothetical protein [Georgenia sp. SYP-B2076]